MHAKAPPPPPKPYRKEHDDRLLSTSKLAPPAQPRPRKIQDEHADDAETAQPREETDPLADAEVEEEGAGEHDAAAG